MNLSGAVDGFLRHRRQIVAIEVDIQKIGGRARREGLVPESASTRTGRAWRGPSPPKRARRSATVEVDAITFTSASTVRGFVGAMGVVRGNPKVVSIGPVTAKEAREHGLRVSAVARPHTIEGLVAALERVLGARSVESRA